MPEQSRRRAAAVFWFRRRAGIISFKAPWRRKNPAFAYRICYCDNQSQKCAIVIDEDPESGFWAEVPALPGCYSQAETMRELLSNVREAISGVLEVMREQGKQPEQNIRILDLAI